ncbi:MAG: hypothetical protein WCC28_12440, partial [Mycobacterium sp.]|uniref:hypothetical protein n=1 Tax=Mycobacterium sp. TaxID=1785 RepID=UPI003C7538DC
YSCPVVDQLWGPDPAEGQEQDRGARRPAVFVATPMYGGMAMGAYVSSLAQTSAIFIQNGLGLLYQYRMNDALVANARNQLAHQFLESQATHLMWIDADIGFNPTDIVSMVLADQDIVCGVYPMKAIDWKRVAQAVNDGVPPEELKSHVGAFVVDPIDGTPGSAAANSDGLVEIAAGGAGFMLVKRVVFEALSPEVPEYAIEGMVVKEFYTTGIDPESSELVSEDYYFCRLARSFGFKVYAAPWVRLTHTGPYIYESQLQPNWLT